jgi:hypothetical protein
MSAPARRIDLTPERLAAANINPATYLATDYLNHFNEMIMLLEMLPDMPDMLADVLSWQPKSYPRHFADTGFANKELAIAAYEAASTNVRRRFDGLVADIDTILLSMLGTLRDREPNADLAPLVAEATHTLHALIEAASGVINGTDDGHVVGGDEEPVAQAQVDAVFATA